ncbi:NADP-dependent phosphogluconate dehydrogenase [Candidatus Peregrinibacteria bacterium]|nr:NADP-dependent phosphogluconate dehydrogenase [Candidatus Peregrinibacteria bacterium]
MQLGVIGLSTMGGNLARNAARNGATVAVYNRTQERTDEFIKAYKTEGTFVPCRDYSYLIAALKPPRPILIMVKAGDAVDQVIAELVPLLSKGDILIDGGNSFYRDSERREKELTKKGIRFLGMGVSGGEEGALWGPSMMPGGDKSAYELLEPLLKKLAADDGSTELTTGGGKCVSYIGSGGAGHFVKMVHNGIEYGLMQLIAEAYHLLKSEGKVPNKEFAEIFGGWSKSGFLQSFLIEITAKIFRKKDDLTGLDLIDVILDEALQKGTGKWTTTAAMDYGVPIPTITAGVDARIISGWKEFRMEEGNFAPPALEEKTIDKTSLIEDVRFALELSFTAAYAQGLQLLSAASREEKWEIPMSEVARIWRGGCIIRSALLPLYQKLIEGDKEAGKTMLEYTGGEHQRAWRRVISLSALRGIPMPATSASLSYYDAYRTKRLPQNLIQAMRDFFGAHTYRRVDKPGTFHSDWQ